MKHLEGEEWLEEEVWHCLHCDRAEARPIPGRLLICPTCGHPKGREETYVADPQAAPRPLQDPVLGPLEQAGANTPCPWCQAEARGDQTRCERCGGLLAPDPAPARAATTTAATTPAPTVAPDPARAARPAWHLRVLLPLALLWVLGLLLVGRGACTHEVDASVEETAWRTTATLWRAHQVQGRGYLCDAPAGSWSLGHCQSAPHPTRVCGSRRVNPHTVQVRCGSQQSGTRTERYLAGTRACDCERRCRSIGSGVRRCGRYCSRCPVWATRTVPRMVPRYCSEVQWDRVPVPCVEQVCDWARWVWASAAAEPGGTRTAEGRDSPLLDPPLRATGPQERLERQDDLRVRLRAHDGRTWVWRPPTRQAFGAYHRGQPWRLRLDRHERLVDAPRPLPHASAR